MLQRIINFLRGLVKSEKVTAPKQEAEESHQVVSESPVVGESQVLQDVPSKPKQVLLRYPKAIEGRRMVTQGKYRYGYPEGVVVHYTSGWDRNFDDAINTFNWGVSEGLCFDIIAPGGEIITGAPLDEFGSHAGLSKWNGLPGDRVSKFLRGIEVASGGMLNSNLETDFKRKYTEDQVRRLNVTTPEWGQAGIYSKFTEKQEAALTEYILWLYHNSPFRNGERVFKLDLVVAHHEVSGLAGLGYWRKPDCGGCLSMPMDKYRQYLKGLV
jgi:N-acetyl-anhydromuramyl-L-alanine amidase AmpD